MILKIQTEKEKITILLKNSGKTVDNLILYGENSLTDDLLLKIDDFLKKNSIDKNDIKFVKVVIAKDVGFTTGRVIQTIANAWNMV